MNSLPIYSIQGVKTLDFLSPKIKSLSIWN